ncbi:hypothetical protein [Streptomyces sp. NRRL B-24484]|uniref:hypothetical protein n=1 Tax=Streptomyces sp. NRRL B-24484 TaxID=1463833 RepID=UPI0005BD1B87|nr:hypothetical protein [Streptomyces sp. NRRL B-24484]
MDDGRTRVWEPPPAQVEQTYQPVEVRFEDGSWAVGRINAWWRPADGGPWCRVRVLRRGGAERWMPFDPEQVLLLPAGGI